MSYLVAPPSSSLRHPLLRLAAAAAVAARSHPRFLAAMPYSVSASSPALGAVPDSAVNKPHHVKAKNGSTSHYQNPHPSGIKDFGQWDIPRIILKGHLDGSLRFPAPKPGDKLVNVQAPTFLEDRFASKELRTTWLGHACHYTEFPSGLRVLFDPVMEDRCSPFTFAGPKRYTRRACAIADLPHVDAVVISHNHYDHLSLATLKEIKKNFPQAHYFVGLGLTSWFRDSGFPNVTEMDWWEDANLTVELDEGQTITATVSCLPAQHTSSRYSLDTDRTLWCSWAVKSTGPSSAPLTKSIYFGGDTGYRKVPQIPEDEDDYGEKYAHLPSNPDFKEIGKLRGPFDVGLIPIGAYKPRFLFSPVHADPQDAVEIFRDTQCKKALAIHWGTWSLTSEPLMEPPIKLRAAMKKRGLQETGVFDVCDIGESRSF